MLTALRWPATGHNVLAFGVLALIAVTAYAAAWQPLWLLVPAAVVGVGLTLRFPQPAALALLVSGPFLATSFSFGALTADNVLVLAGLLVVGILAVATRRIPFTRWSLLPLLLGMAIFVTGTVNGHPNWEACLRFVALATVPWVVSCNPRRRRSNDRILLGISAVGALSVLAQPVVGYPLPYKDMEETGIRYGGLFGHPNFAAYALSLVVLYVVSSRLTAGKVFLLAVMGGALLMTGSMTALLVLAACLGLILARSFKRLVVASMAAAVFLAFAGQTLLNRLDFAMQTAGGAGAGANSGTWRLGQWNRAFRLLEGHEATGIGWGEIAVRIGNGLGAHSAYVQLLVELGWVATAAVAVGILASVALARTSKVLLVVLAYVLLTSISDPVLFYPSSMTILLFVLAALGGRPAKGILGNRRHAEAVGRRPARPKVQAALTPKHLEGVYRFSEE